MEKIVSKVKTFSNKKIIIRSLLRKDLKQPLKFQNFINSLVQEDAPISLNKKKTLKEELEWLREQLDKIKKKKSVFLIAEYNNVVVGDTGIDLGRGRQNHVGIFGIGVKNGYRTIGIGKYLIREILKESRKKLNPRPKIIKLSVFSTNKPAISLYKKIGFRRVAIIPKQIKYKRRLINEVIMIKEI